MLYYVILYDLCYTTGGGARWPSHIAGLQLRGGGVVENLAACDGRPARCRCLWKKRSSGEESRFIKGEYSGNRV